MSEPPANARPTPAARPPRDLLADHTIPIRRPASRRLNAYAFDPSLSIQLENAALNRITIKVPWEYDPATKLSSLQPGPIGDYLEIVDFDPASGCFYAPVNLDNPYLLAQDGLLPSEGNPQFHQQMVYAVAMTTIKNFERALGRPALWSPHEREDSTPEDPRYDYVPRLRIYPHALREANAYYSPDKKALLFGYFPATTSDVRYHLPGGMVFCCLSHDVIAHETTHALLDGMHRRFLEASNADVLAFHEAFADICALFQHFSIGEVLRQQIARTRGDLTTDNLLAQLAQEFGQATGRHGALRNALGGENKATGRWERAKPDPTAMQTVKEPHARGSLLVAAVFEAFLSIYRTRSADLLRIATSGSGVLPEGMIHPDLVDRLAGEAAKASQHVLHMCIRALDYVPPVDLTFGEYLRALITADYDLVPDDEKHYRVAVIEAFRQYGIYPQDVRSLAVDSLLWRAPLRQDFQPQVLPVLQVVRRFAERQGYTMGRERFYRQEQAACKKLQQVLVDVANEMRAKLGEKETSDRFKQLGLDMVWLVRDGQPVFDVNTARHARRVGPDGQRLDDVIIQVTQYRPGYLDEDRQREVDAGLLSKAPGALDDAPPPDFWFRGGATLIVDLETAAVRYSIGKALWSKPRLIQQRAFLGNPRDASLRGLYFGRLPDETREPFAFLHRL